MLTKDDLNQIRQIAREATADLPTRAEVAAEIAALPTRAEMDVRFATQERWMTARFDRLEGEVDGLARATNGRFNELEERLTLAGI